VVAAGAGAVGLGLTWPDPRCPVAALIGLAVAGWPIVVEAWHDLRRRRMSMELSMLIALVAAAAIGQWLTALLIATFVLAAEILEDLSLDRGHQVLSDLMAFLPSSVTVRHGQRLVQIPLLEVAVGQTVLVSPGQRVPVDGTVLSGRSSVDQSQITGEPLPVDLEPGSPVYAGSINYLGAIELRAERVGTDSSFGHIVEAVRQAQSSPAPAQRLADRLASYLVYLALAAAAVTWLVTGQATSAIAVVVVAGACGIAAGTPLAVLAAIARAARSGAFIKGGPQLEALSRIDLVVLDKTGTLTEGRPRVTAIRPAPGVAADDLLATAAAAELYSEHPLGRAIVDQAQARQLDLRPPDRFDYRPGLGLRADLDGRQIRVGNQALVPEAPPTATTDGASLVQVARDQVWLGSIHLADTVRPSARRCVADLHALGLRLMMLTGDQAEAARAVADQLGLDQVEASLLPEQKLALIDAQRAQGHHVAMVGDGVNDAPALARADVGLAMGSGADIARQSADVLLVGSDLAALSAALTVARRARRIVWANFVGTVLVDLVGLGLAAAGLLTPVWAALVHVGSETAFILNSARLIPGPRSRTRT
jgi:heavy metal translocating P-type ATPase